MRDASENGFIGNLVYRVRSKGWSEHEESRTAAPRESSKASGQN